MTLFFKYFDSFSKEQDYLLDTVAGHETVQGQDDLQDKASQRRMSSVRLSLHTESGVA